MGSMTTSNLGFRDLQRADGDLGFVLTRRINKDVSEVSLDYYTPNGIGPCCEIGRFWRNVDVERRLGYVRSEQSEHCTVLGS